MGRRGKVAVIGGVFAGMVGGAGYGTYNFVSALNGDGGGGTGSAGPAPLKSGPPSSDEVEGTSAKFFAGGGKGAGGRGGGTKKHPPRRGAAADGVRRGRPHQ